jgi:hypothetical protein
VNRCSFVGVREVIAGIGGVTPAAFAAAALCRAGEPAPRALSWQSSAGF